MVKRAFTVRALWDDEAGIFYSESDITGFHIEAGSIEEFEQLMMELAPDLVIANHISMPDLARTPLRDLVPAILWQRPADKVA